MTAPPIILWMRRDLRLSDHPMLSEAAASGRPVIPVFILDEVAQGYGAAPLWRLGEGLRVFGETLERMGSRLILRSGDALEVIRVLIHETGATDVWWTRAYDPEAITRDSRAKSSLKEEGIYARSFNGAVLFEPWTVQTKQGGFFKVFSPMWRAVKDRDVPSPDPRVAHLKPPLSWPKSEELESWNLRAQMHRGAEIVGKYIGVGEQAALARLDTFLGDLVESYKTDRDFPAKAATSRLSDNVAWGEIGPRTIWHAAQRALHEGATGAEHFLKELTWREFSHHLIYHTPHIATRNWRAEWDHFPWGEAEDEDVLRWKQGQTGIPLVDAAMRELYVTGYMHNRGRMIVGSYLTKHMMKNWRIGQAWFAECLVDWDPAQNAMGWQWVAGSGPDAAPYFRIFNPETQALKFDGNREYICKYVAELSDMPSAEALDFFAACPPSWGFSPAMPYPAPLIDLAVGRQRALAAYQAR